jgi:hypothetical protein
MADSLPKLMEAIIDICPTCSIAMDRDHSLQNITYNDAKSAVDVDSSGMYFELGKLNVDMGNAPSAEAAILGMRFDCAHMYPKASDDSSDAATGIFQYAQGLDCRTFVFGKPIAHNSQGITATAWAAITLCLYVFMFCQVRLGKIKLASGYFLLSFNALALPTVGAVLRVLAITSGGGASADEFAFEASKLESGSVFVLCLAWFLNAQHLSAFAVVVRSLGDSADLLTKVEALLLCCQARPSF